MSFLTFIVGTFAALAGLVLLLAVTWVAFLGLGDARKARAASRRRKLIPGARCPCGCGRHIRDVPALPRDGRPLDSYENRHLASVIKGYLAAPAESSDEKEHHQ